MKAEINNPKVEMLSSSSPKMERMEFRQAKIETPNIQTKSEPVEKSHKPEFHETKHSFPIQRPDSEKSSSSVMEKNKPAFQATNFSPPKMEKMQTEINRVFSPVATPEKSFSEAKPSEIGKSSPQSSNMEKPEFDSSRPFSPMNENKRMEMPQFESPGQKKGSSAVSFHANDPLSRLASALESMIGQQGRSDEFEGEQAPQYSDIFMRDEHSRLNSNY